MSADLREALTYAAFISYRRQDPDRKWARWLQRKLEAYRVPRRLRREKGLPRVLGKVCRDDGDFSAAGHLDVAMAGALHRRGI